MTRERIKKPCIVKVKFSHFLGANLRCMYRALHLNNQRVNMGACVCVCPPHHLEDKKLSRQHSDGALWQVKEVDIKT